MGTKIQLQDIAAILSHKNGMPKRDVEQFIKTFFDAISDGVLSDKHVKVKGLGTFKLVEVGERESVNVNTGERIVIPGHSKVTFTPENELRAHVNKPFEAFQTVILNEGTNLEEMERMPEEDSSIIPEEEEDSLIAEEDTVLSKPVEEQVPNVEETRSSTATEKGELPTEGKENIESDTNKEETKGEAPASSAVATEEHTTAPQTENAQPLVEATPALGEPRVVREVIIERRPPLSLPCFISLIVVIFMLMLGSYFVGYFRLLCPPCEAMFEGRNEIHSTTIREQKSSSTQIQKAPTSKQTVPTKKTDTVATPAKGTIPAAEKGDSLKPATTAQTCQPAPSQSAKHPTPPKVSKEEQKKAVLPIAPLGEKEREELLKRAANYRQVPGGKYLIVGTAKERTIKYGEHLYKIAREEYGDKELARYIIVHNHFPNPDNIPVGTVVKVPDLRETTER